MPIASSKDITYTNPVKRTNSVDEAIISYSKKDTRQISSAVVRCTSKASGEKTWHPGGTDPNAPEHVTTELKDENGNHVTT
ncbi:hypothetical protein BJY00DRAFT_297103, partial [Aspergillus carlsbadensis]